MNLRNVLSMSAMALFAASSGCQTVESVEPSDIVRYEDLHQDREAPYRAHFRLFVMRWFERSGTVYLLVSASPEKPGQCGYSSPNAPTVVIKLAPRAAARLGLIEDERFPPVPIEIDFEGTMNKQYGSVGATMLVEWQYEISKVKNPRLTGARCSFELR